MKRLRFILSFVALAAIIIFGTPGEVSAVACAPAADYGSSSYAIPTLPATGTYTIWSRLNVPDSTNNSYYAEITQGNSVTCIRVGDSSNLPVNTWKWVNYQNGDVSSLARYNFSSTTGYTLKMIGAESNVKLDKILLIADDCIPQDAGFGDNCGTAVVPNPAGSGSTTGSTTPGADGSIIVVPSPPGQVSGVVDTSPTLRSAPSSVSKVEYYVNGRAVQKSRGAVALDTSLLKNGSQTVETRITLKDGSVINEQTTLDVNNKQTVFSPVVRWFRLNRQPLLVASLVTGVTSFLGAGFFTSRYIYLHNRGMKFHGF